MATRNGGGTPEVNLVSGKTSLFLRTDEEKHQTPESSDVKNSSSEQKANFDSRFAPSLSEPQSSRESSALRWYHNTTSTGSAPTASPSNWREIALAQQKKNHDLWQHVRRLENQIAHFNAVSEESSATDNSKQKASEGFSGLELSQLRNNLAVVQAEVGLWKERSLSSEKLIQALEALVKQRDEENKILKQDLASLGQHLQAQSQHEIGGGMRVQQEPSASPGLQNVIHLLKAKFQRVQLAQQDIYHRSLGHVSCFHRAKYIPVVQSLTESSHI